MDGFQALPAPPLFARQPVFTADLNVFGHELLYRQALTSTQAVFTDLDAATLTVVAGAFQWHPGDLAGGQKILVNFGRKTILDKAPYALPSDRTVVQVEENVQLDSPLLETLTALKADGYLLAVDGFNSLPEASSLLDIADLVIIDVLGKSKQALQGLLQPVLAKKLRAVAQRVEDKASFVLCKSLGFSLFQGYFFKRPEVVAGKRLASNELARIKLLRLTQADHPDENALRDAIRSDVSLSYRLLSYLNSPLNGQRMSRLSIPRALLVLGWTHLRHWLKVIALTDLSPSGKTSELSFLSLQRARFFEVVGQGLGRDSAETENLFTLGLFSLLDAMLHAPMQEILLNLPLDAVLKDALLTQHGEYARWMNMALQFEQGDWAGLENTLEALNIPASLAAEGYTQAMEFAASFTRTGS
ncbi:MAG: HDOD domain-containing protein [Desulfovibrio sp.]|nr:HDOD domain-containing protein [Desulfovibrio sp.]MBI4960732.1 HDOD domain-containing protein [Desulfovibrio sp.]